jgi:hypothetical protein
LCGSGGGDCAEQHTGDYRDAVSPSRLMRRDDRKPIHDSLSCATHFAGVKTKNKRLK